MYVFGPLFGFYFVMCRFCLYVLLVCGLFFSFNNKSHLIIVDFCVWNKWPRFFFSKIRLRCPCFSFASNKFFQFNYKQNHGRHWFFPFFLSFLFFKTIVVCFYYFIFRTRCDKSESQASLLFHPLPLSPFINILHCMQVADNLIKLFVCLFVCL